MNLISSLYYHIYKFIAVFLASLTMTIVVCSLLVKEQKRFGDYYEDEIVDNNNNSYDDYFEAKFKATVEYIDNIIYIKDVVDKVNKEQRIFNQHRFGPVKKTTFFVVVQVRDNIALLKELLKSLKKVMGITSSLLIFCHNYYDDNINKAISEIKFAKYMQIFYPYSSQLYPKMFPGRDPKFCYGDFNCSALCTASNECLRSYDLVQEKHFWWWQVNFVFDHLKVMKDHYEPVVFLEDSQYILSDLLFMLKVLGTVVSESCNQCEILSFGAHAPAISQYHTINGKVRIEPWDQSVSSLGIAFNRTVWQNIKNNSYHFCHFNDYRWDTSLNYLGNQRPQGQFIMLSSEAPRVIQIGHCDGVKRHCTLKNLIEDVYKFAKMVHRGLYPRNLVISNDDRRPGILTEAGEWRDVRDRALCTYFTEMK